MNKILFLLSVLFASSAIAQTENFKPCIADSMDLIEQQNDPNVLVNRKKFQEFLKTFKGAEKSMTASGTILFTIPVVFHVIHNYGVENIPNQQISDAMVVLNESFQKLNSDTVDVIPFFQPVFADCQIQFRLATIDPSGNCTNGITRTQSVLTYNAGNNVKALIDWPNGNYINIWVVQHIASGAAGYAYLPGAANNIDGIEILYDYVGGPQIGHYASRSLAHEMGHHLGLKHVWGQGNTPGLSSNCNIDDGISDTPLCAGTSSTATCNLSQNTCNTSIAGDSVDNVQNYMDYAGCHKMFTNGQKNVMHAALSSSVSLRDDLSTPSNLIATGTEDGHVATLCAPKSDFTNNPIYICEGSTVQFNDASWGGDATAWQWDFQGGIPAQAFTKNASVQYNVPGTYDVSLISTNSVGSDTLIRTMLVNVLPDTGTNTVPFSEGFESISIPGNEWAVENSNSNSAFVVSTAAAFTGAHSVVLQNSASGNNNGSVDELITPSLEFTNVTGATLTFKYAFAAKNSADSSYLKVFVSTNCGQNWVQRLLKSSTALQTAPVSAGSFVPTSSQWATQTINLGTSQFNGKPSVRVRFEYWQDRGNNLYLDDINITGPVGINELLSQQYQVSVYPNPAHSFATLELELTQSNAVQIDLYDMLGKKVADIVHKTLGAGEQRFEIPNKNYEGIYFVRVSIGNDVLNQKIVFVK